MVQLGQLAGRTGLGQSVGAIVVSVSSRVLCLGRSGNGTIAGWELGQHRVVRSMV